MQFWVDEIIFVGIDFMEIFVVYMVQFDQIIQVYNIDEVIFFVVDVVFVDIIGWMIGIWKENFDYKIVQLDSDFLIGSNFIEIVGDLYIMDINMLLYVEMKCCKCLFDVMVVLLLLIVFLVLVFLMLNLVVFWKNIFVVLVGRKMLVGYLGEKYF